MGRCGHCKPSGRSDERCVAWKVSSDRKEKGLNFFVFDAKKQNCKKRMWIWKKKTQDYKKKSSSCKKRMWIWKKKTQDCKKKSSNCKQKSSSCKKKSSSCKKKSSAKRFGEKRLSRCSGLQQVMPGKA